MSDAGLSLNNFFFPAADSSEDLGVEDVDSEAWDELKSGLQKELPKVAWKAVGREIKTKISEVLEAAGLDKVMSLGWQKMETLQEYRDPSLHPRGESALVPLAEHTIESHHQPHVDVVVRDFEIGSVCLDVSLKLHLEGVLLKIEDGRIRGTHGGSCRAEGDLKATVTTKAGSRDLFALHRDIAPFELGQLMNFGEGIEIPDLTRLAEVVRD